jgi:hypothetical protein
MKKPFDAFAERLISKNNRGEPLCTFGITAIPEPTSLTQMGLGFLGMTGYCLRRLGTPILAGKRKRRIWCS